MNRRDFIRQLGAGALTAALPGVVLAVPAEVNRNTDYRNLLVLIELKGANDGLNTLIPYADSMYYALRPRLAIRREEVVTLTERAGLHPSLASLLPLWQSGELALVQGVGYPTPNLSHFRSIEIWDTASKSDETLAEGWLARAFAQARPPRDLAADGLLVGAQEPGPLAGARTVALANPEQFLRQARPLQAHTGRVAAPPSALSHLLGVESDIVQAASRLGTAGAGATLSTVFPQTQFGNSVKASMQVLASGAKVATIRLSLNGFDTHQNQPGTHANLLRQFAEGMIALRSALIELGRWDSTLVMSYSEFGRRAAENASNGTDHGTAGVQFALGGRVKGGLYGEAPRLDRLDNGNLVHTVDFRSLYATVLERLWGADSTGVLRGRFAPLDLMRA